MQDFLYQKLDTVSKMGFLSSFKSVPLYVSRNLNERFEIREYQKEAYARFTYYYSQYPDKILPIHLLFNMATGSGKTFVMASLILELYEKGYRNFLFFVNSTNIIQKTKENFLNETSSKYLFADKIIFDGRQVKIKEVTNFSSPKNDDICIKFTTIQGLHTDLNGIKEGGVSYEDFEDSKIVILSDEAHHINATTKNGKLGKSEQEEKTSWEYTVMKILNSHKENLLLEFTATAGLENEYVALKYKDKVIYKYDLKEFRLDGYSKEVDILKADMEQDDRILQALLLSQYRLKIAEKNRIYCKPVILFKAQKTVAESEANLVNFHKIIKELKEESILKIQQTSKSPVVQKAFDYFEKSGTNWDRLVRELQEDFAPENCISANDESETGKNQILLNTLEDKNNRIRAVFAVQKLNEGWDVLNLFDIIRLYEGRDGDWKKNGEYNAGKTTMSEAQLIGRGARYFPFSTNKALGEDKYKRKFDKKDEEELKILETFYYHTSFDNKYISEITQALVKTGMFDEKDKEDFSLKLKDTFKKTQFYQEGVIYLNERKLKDTKSIDSLEKVGLRQERFEFTLYTGNSGDIKVFDDVKEIQRTDVKIEREPKIIEMSDIDIRTIRKAIQRNDFYKFDNLKSYIGALESIDDFITSEKYLGAKKLCIFSSETVLNNISIEDTIKIVEALLNKLEAEIKEQEILYQGTKEFTPQSIQSIFIDKIIKVEKGVTGFSKNKDWFIFEKINATSEEEDFIGLFETKIAELEKKYQDIYLLRSERHFALYSFEKGERFEPDFVLMMREKETKKPLTYQVFIEPKGSHLLLVDKWKEDFSLEIENTAEILDMNLGNYKLIGLPFYNKGLENEFEKAFDSKFI